MVRSFLVLSLLPLLLPIALADGTAPTTTTPTSKTKSSSAHSGSPFSAFTKSLPQEKKKPFMELMKRLRGAKAATVGSKDEKKKVMGALDADIHKLLGSEYKRYRTVQHAQHEMHTALKKGTSTSTAAAKPVVAPPPPVATATSTGTKKKKSGLPGMAGKKKASSTTVG